MPYTRAWNDATPAGTRAANQIDDAIREFKVDVHERMDSLVVDWTADPVVPKPEFGGEATKTMIIHGAQFQIDNDVDNDYGGDGIGVLNSFPPARCPLVLPPLVTITKIRWLVTNTNAAATTMTLKRLLFTTATTQDTVNTQTHAASGAAIIDSSTSGSPINHIVVATHAYFLEFDTASMGCTLHAVELTYTAHSSKETL